MDMTWLGQIGYALPLCLGGVGSALGIAAAGRAAAGAWAKEANAGKGLNAKHLVLIGMPLSQTIYGFLVMLLFLQDRVLPMNPQEAGLIFGVGLGVGLAQMFSAWMQGIIGAAGVRAVSEADSKPFAFILTAMGICETVGLFAFALWFMLMPKAAEIAAVVAPVVTP
jgi:V/A-type H+-transporting ATPase subunit K